MKPTHQNYEELVLDLLAEPGTSKDALGSLVIRIMKGGDSLPTKEEALRMERNLRKKIRRDERRHRELEKKAAMQKSAERPTPEDQSDRIIAGEAHSVLHRAILDLGATLQAVVHAHYFEEKTVREIAAERGVAPGTISCQLFRAREKIRDSMTRSFGSLAWAFPLAHRQGIEWTSKQMPSCARDTLLWMIRKNPMATLGVCGGFTAAGLAITLGLAQIRERAGPPTEGTRRVERSVSPTRSLRPLPKPERTPLPGNDPELHTPRPSNASLDSGPLGSSSPDSEASLLEPIRWTAVDAATHRELPTLELRQVPSGLQRSPRELLEELPRRTTGRCPLTTHPEAPGRAAYVISSPGYLPLVCQAQPAEDLLVALRPMGEQVIRIAGTLEQPVDVVLFEGDREIDKISNCHADRTGLLFAGQLPLGTYELRLLPSRGAPETFTVIDGQQETRRPAGLAALTVTIRDRNMPLTIPIAPAQEPFTQTFVIKTPPNAKADPLQVLVFPSGGGVPQTFEGRAGSLSLVPGEYDVLVYNFLHHERLRIPTLRNDPIELEVPEVAEVEFHCPHGESCDGTLQVRPVLAPGVRYASLTNFPELSRGTSEVQLVTGRFQVEPDCGMGPRSFTVESGRNLVWLEKPRPTAKLVVRIYDGQTPWNEMYPPFQVFRAHDHRLERIPNPAADPAGIFEYALSPGRIEIQGFQAPGFEYQPPVSIHLTRRDAHEHRVALVRDREAKQE